MIEPNNNAIAGLWLAMLYNRNYIKECGSEMEKEQWNEAFKWLNQFDDNMLVTLNRKKP